jgi:hypothetical protein
MRKITVFAAWCLIALASPALATTPGAGLDAALGALESRIEALERHAVQPEPPVQPDPPPVVVDPPPPVATTSPTSCAEVIGWCAELSDTTDPMAWPDLLQKYYLESRRAPATILVHPGKYSPAAGPWMGKLNGLSIIGILGPNGQRPHISGLAGKHSAFFYVKPESTGTYRLENLEISHYAGNCFKAGSWKIADTKQRIEIHNVWIHHCGGKAVMIGYERPETGIDDVFIATDSDFSHSSQTHVLYIDRVKYAEFRRVRAWSPGSRHVLKCEAQTCIVTDGEFSNARLDGGLDRKTEWPSKGGENGGRYLGSNPVDFAACSKVIFARNKVLKTYLHGGNFGGAYGAVRNIRKAISGCDMPVEYGIDAQFPPNYWQEIAAGGTGGENVALHPFSGFWSHNRFEFVAFDGMQTSGLRAILNMSTIPSEAEQPGSSRAKPVPAWLPEGWIERSREHSVNNCLIGIPRSQAFSNNLSNAYDGSPAPPQDQFTDYGGTCTTPITLPAWWPSD